MRQRRRKKKKNEGDRIVRAIQKGDTNSQLVKYTSVELISIRLLPNELILLLCVCVGGGEGGVFFYYYYYKKKLMFFFCYRVKFCKS